VARKVAYYVSTILQHRLVVDRLRNCTACIVLDEAGYVEIVRELMDHDLRLCGQ